jgi:hypothetical protein
MKHIFLRQIHVKTLNVSLYPWKSKECAVKLPPEPEEALGEQ